MVQVEKRLMAQELGPARGGKDPSYSSKTASKSRSGTDGFLSSRSNVPRRIRYVKAVVLKSLNGTFDSKHLLVPFQPDVLKLGRPVIPPNSIDGPTPSLTSSLSSPSVINSDNGFFDSRVLSRNHAHLSCDPHTGAIFIRDLNSSNGTFLNGKRIGNKDTELQVGDVINLGTDIDNKPEHRKIEAFVENIIIIPLVKGLNHSAAFESSVFGDSNRLGIEDLLFGAEPQILSGIFMNNQIRTSKVLVDSLKILATQLSLSAHQRVKLHSIQKFLVSYCENIELNNHTTMHDQQREIALFQNDIKQASTDRLEKIAQDYQNQLDLLEQSNKKLVAEYSALEVEHLRTISQLERDIEDVKTRLEVEKYKNLHVVENKKLQETENPTKQKHNWKEKAPYALVTGITIAFVAIALKLPQR